MLAGRYPSDEFAELRPRIVWDRTAGVVRGREGARRLAVTNAGTIPDRGLSACTSSTAAGAWRARRGDGLRGARRPDVPAGASTWRIEEITRDRVLVTPASGVPGAVLFWKGEGVGRPYELGEKIGRASRGIVALSDTKALEALRDEYRLDERAASNLLAFLREQEGATQVIPSDRTVVAERFRDEIGDWRVCLLTLFGARVHAPWAMALTARIRDSLGLEVQSIWSDDGIALHFPDADAPPPVDELLLDPATSTTSSSARSASPRCSARGSARTRRALLIPRRRPDQRTPLWQQRLKAQALLQVARKYPTFPIVLETYRECLQDVFDLPAPGRAPAGHPHARARPRRRRDAVRVAVLVVASLRLHRHVHVRGRHACRRAARAGAVLIATCCVSCSARRSPRPARPRRHRAGGAACCAGRRRTRTSCTISPAARRSPARPLRRGACGDPDPRAPRDPGSSCARERLIAAEDAGRYRDARGDAAARRPAGRVPRGRRAAAALTRSSVRQRARAVHDRGSERSLRRVRGGRAARPRAG